MEKEQGQGRVKQGRRPIQFKGPLLSWPRLTEIGVLLCRDSEEARGMSHLRVDVVDIFLLALIS